MSFFVENGTKAKLSIYHHLLSNFEEFKRLTRPIKHTEYSYLQQSRFLSASMQEDISLLQLCILGHGFNEDIYLIGENSSIGVLERTLYATFSYSAKEPVEFIIIPIWHYSDKTKEQLVNLLAGIVKKKTKSFLWRSSIENPYNKVYDEIISIFSGNSTKISSDLVEYYITKN